MMYPAHYREFIDELVRVRGQDREQVRDELLAVAHAAAVGLLGDETPIEIDYSEDLEAIRLWQTLAVVEEVRAPKREIALADAQRFAPEFEPGESVLISIHYTHDPREAEARKQMAWAASLLPLPLHVEGLWDAIGAALDAHLQRDFPPPDLAEETLWRLLAGGGGWLIGQMASSAGTILAIEGAWLKFTRQSPARGYVDAGLVLKVFGAGGEREWRLRYTDNDAIARDTLGLPTGQGAKDRVSETLAALAAAVAAAGETGLSEYTACKQLLTAAIEAPHAGSLWAWCTAELAGLLVGHRCEFTAGGRALAFAITAVQPPALDLVGFGGCHVELTFTDLRTGEPVVAWQSIGSLDRAALRAPGPDAAAQRDIAAMAASYKGWLDVHVADHLSREPFELNDLLLYGMAGHFPLVDLVTARLQHGPPPPVPVPPPGPEDIQRIAALLRPASPDTRARALAHVNAAQLVAVFELGPYAIVVLDDLGREFPHAAAFVGLLAPGIDGLCEVLRVDVWNHPSRAVVDGDAFAFRRLCECLGGALLASGLDVPIVYTGEDDRDEDEDEDDEDSEDSYEEDEDGPLTLMLSEWLRFGLPDVGDRFLVDWRHQWHVAFAGAGIVECFGGIYGMEGARREAIDGRDRQVWRAFLREVVDPRFA